MILTGGAKKWDRATNGNVKCVCSRIKCIQNNRYFCTPTPLLFPWVFFSAIRNKAENVISKIVCLKNIYISIKVAKKKKVKTVNLICNLVVLFNKVQSLPCHNLSYTPLEEVRLHGT